MTFATLNWPAISLRVRRRPLLLFQIPSLAASFSSDVPRSLALSSIAINYPNTFKELEE